MRTKRERFINSKCDRCGKATKPVQNAEHDLYLLPDEWAESDKCLADQGSFCQPCIDKYPPDDWLAWLMANRATDAF